MEPRLSPTLGPPGFLFRFRFSQARSLVHCRFNHSLAAPLAWMCRAQHWPSGNLVVPQPRSEVLCQRRLMLTIHAISTRFRATPWLKPLIHHL